MLRMSAILGLVLCTSAALAQTPPVTISAVYGGGGSATSLWRCDFIELHNRTNMPITVSGWSVQYASATGVSWQVTPLTGIIPPCGYLLVGEACGAAGMPLPPVDVVGTIAMSNSAGKVALVNSVAALAGACPLGNPSIVDFVGYGATASCWETAPGPSVAPGLSVSASLQRLDNGCVDTNNNGADFTRVDPAPAPRNAQSPPYCCDIGACCIPPNGACVETSPSHCHSLGGVFTGPGIPCSINPCQTEACCLATGCADLDPNQCLQSGGQPQGPGTTCANVNFCRQACCFQNGVCQDLTVVDCQVQGGQPQGANTTCATTICPVATGACCLPDGQCIEVPPGQCTAGQFQGLGSTCTPNPCRGACCLPDGTCIITPPGQCTAGQFQGIGSTCDPNPCRGACCLPNGQCIETAAADCSGQFLGAGTSCTPNPCRGACCFPDGTCIITLPLECTAGQFQGIGSSCVPNPCVGVCCFRDGSCLMLPPLVCDQQGGFPGPMFEPCTPDRCKGACCLPDGSCMPLASLAQCDAVGGTFQGFGSDCVGVICPTVEACCFQTGGGCADVSPAQCIANGGTPQGPGTTCASVNFCRQACCLPNGMCVDVFVFDCNAQNGTPQGTGSTCATTTCVEACCFQTSCANLPPNQCLAAGGTPQGPGTTCVSVNFCRQACCFPDASCVDLVPAACIPQGGAPQGPGTICATTDCRIACCYPNGACADVALNVCTSTGGNPQGPGSSCATTICPVQFPACCLPNGTCVPTPAAQCIASGGYLVGPTCVGVQCVVDRCENVLVGDANCDNLVNNFDIDFFVEGVLVGSPPDPTLAPPGYLGLGGTQACWDRRRCWGDINCDGLFNNFDIDPFVACILATPPPGQGCPSCAPQACCLPGNCAVLYPAGCTMAGGTPQGAGTDCLGVVCP